MSSAKTSQRAAPNPGRRPTTAWCTPKSSVASRECAAWRDPILRMLPRLAMSDGSKAPATGLASPRFDLQHHRNDHGQRPCPDWGAERSGHS